jgi:hypothetical protein
MLPWISCSRIDPQLHHGSGIAESLHEGLQEVVADPAKVRGVLAFNLFERSQRDSLELFERLGYNSLEVFERFVNRIPRLYGQLECELLDLLRDSDIVSLSSLDDSDTNRSNLLSDWFTEYVKSVNNSDTDYESPPGYSSTWRVWLDGCRLDHKSRTAEMAVLPDAKRTGSGFGGPCEFSAFLQIGQLDLILVKISYCREIIPSLIRGMIRATKGKRSVTRAVNSLDSKRIGRNG